MKDWAQEEAEKALKAESELYVKALELWGSVEGPEDILDVLLRADPPASSRGLDPEEEAELGKRPSYELYALLAEEEEWPPTATFVIDIDGTVADSSWRAPMRESSYERWVRETVNDKVLPWGKILEELLKSHHDVMFLTGRPEKQRGMTEAWLARHFPSFDPEVHPVYCKPSQSREPDAVFKVRKLLDLGLEVFVFIDDLPENIRAVSKAFERAYAYFPEEGWPLVRDFLRRRRGLKKKSAGIKVPGSTVGVVSSLIVPDEE